MVASLLVASAVGPVSSFTAQAQKPPASEPSGQKPDAPDSSDEKKPKFEATAELSFVGTTADQSTTTLGSNSDVTWRPRRWELNNTSSWIDNRANGATTGTLNLDSKIRRALTKHWGALVEHTALRTTTAVLSTTRHTATAGAEYTFVKNDAQTFRTSAAAGYDNRAGEMGKAGMSLLLGSDYERTLPNDGAFKHELHWLNPLTVAHRSRLDMETSLEVSITHILSRTVSSQIRRSAFVKPGSRHIQSTTSIAFGIKFARAQDALTGASEEQR